MAQQGALVHDQRWHEPADDDEVVHHVSELGRHVEARRADELDLLALVFGGSLRFVRHGASSS